MGMIFLLFPEPIISDQLILIGISENVIGYIFALACLAYAAAAPLVGRLVQKYKKENLTFFAFALSTIAIYLEGPSQIFGFSPSNILMTTFCFIFLGSMEAFIFVPMIPLISEAVESQELQALGDSIVDSSDFQDALNDRVSCLYQTAQGVGCILGPMIGGALNDRLGF
jgi:MFS family permease